MPGTTSPQQAGASGWDVDHGLAAIQLLVNRRKGSIAEILAVVAGQEADAVGLECVEGVFDFLQAAVGIGRSDRGKQAEFARMIGNAPGAIFVDRAPESCGFPRRCPTRCRAAPATGRRCRCRSCPCRRATSAPTISAPARCARPGIRDAPGAENGGECRSWSWLPGHGPRERRVFKAESSDAAGQEFAAAERGPGGIGGQHAQFEKTVIPSSLEPHTS